jgi:hypothetical protein
MSEIDMEKVASFLDYDVPWMKRQLRESGSKDSEL